MATRGRKRAVPEKQPERKTIYLMKKKDLRTGMTVECRNGDKFFVMLCTGLQGEEENILFCGGKWLSLDWYNDDMTATDRCDPFSSLILRPGVVRNSEQYDIMTVYGIHSASEISGSMSYEEYVLYRREEL